MRDGYRAMSERCEEQLPPAAPVDRESECLSLRAAAFAVAAALLFYTWWLTLAAGAACGCVVALCIARSRHVHAYIALLKIYLSKPADQSQTSQQESECAACGAAECTRHTPPLVLEPWAGLRLHKQLDQAIEDFYNAIMERFVSSWYDNITQQPYFVDELRHQLRYASAALLRRAHKINYAKLIVEKLVPCALHHHSVWTEAQRHRQRCEDASRSLRHELARSNGPFDDTHGQTYSAELSDIEAAALAGPLRCSLHPAVRSRADELSYLRCVTAAIMPYLLRVHEVHNRVFQVLIREIFAGWVLLSLTDVLADPYILNTLIVLATGEETMSALPKTPNYRRYPYLPSVPTIFLPRIKMFTITDCDSMVEFLEQFVERGAAAGARRARLLRMELDAVLARQEYLYAFMQYLKAAGQLHLLQFCRDIKPFQIRILNPELTPAEEASIHAEACELHARYLAPGCARALPLAPAAARELREALAAGAPHVGRLRTCRALYDAAEYAERALDTVYLPSFLHSEEFYKLLIGPRIPTGYHKQMTKKSQERLVATAIRIGSKLKGALRSQTIDGQILDCFTNTIDINTDVSVTDGDGLDNMNILRYLDSLAEHTKLEEHDLRNWRISITGVENRQVEGGRSAVRVFTLRVARALPLCADEAGWAVRRTEHDFHLLRGKLTEFHGDTLLQDLTLPSRRDNSPPETLRYKYEDYVQRLLQKSLLATSELLRIFLSAEGDFALAVQRASLGAAGADLANIYQSVAHRLRKEKGQHLEPFMSTFLISSDMQRYQAMKQGSAAPVEEAEEVDEAAAAARGAPGGGGARDIRDRTFGDNFGLARAGRVPRTSPAHRPRLAGFMQCLMYLLVKVVRAPALVCGALGCAAAACRELADRAGALALHAALANALSEPRLAHLIRLGHELLFESEADGRERRHTEEEQCSRARAYLLARTPRLLSLVLGRNLQPALADLHAMLQSPRLNKQLVYNLLDLCISELFPELIEDSPSMKSR